MSYTVKGTDGKVLASVADEEWCFDSPPCGGFRVCLETMKKGEKALLTLKSEAGGKDCACS